MDGAQNRNKGRKDVPDASRSALQRSVCFLVIAGICSAASILLLNALFGAFGALLSLLAAMSLRPLKAQAHAGAEGERVERLLIISYVLLGISVFFCVTIVLLFVFVAPAIDAYLSAVAPDFNPETVADILNGSSDSAWG